jgi:hypothetical protein
MRRTEAPAERVVPTALRWPRKAAGCFGPDPGYHRDVYVGHDHDHDHDRDHHDDHHDKDDHGH